MQRYSAKIVIFFGCLALAALIGGPLYIWFYGLTATAVGLFFFMLIATGMSITAGYHRLYAHRSYKAANWLKVIYLVVGAGSFQQSCLKWASEHRMHHRHVDEDKDPYNIKRGFMWAHIGWLLSAKDPSAPRPKDLTSDPLIMWQHKYWAPIAIVSGFGIPTWIGLCFGDAIGGFLFGGVIRLVVGYQLTFFINSLAHTIGSQSFSTSNSARDSWTTALLTFGEGFHNYHHWYPGDYRNGIRFYDWDPAKWFIRAMSWLGQTWNLKLAPYETILRAKLEVQRGKWKGLGDEKFRQRLDRHFHDLMQRIDEFSRVRREWVLAVKESSEQKARSELYLLKQRLRDAKQRYRSAYRDWRHFCRQARRQVAMAA